MTSQASSTLLQRIDVALTSALRNDHRQDALMDDVTHRLHMRDLFIKGVAERDLPISLARAKLHTPHSGMALTINSFFPWRQASRQLELAGRTGFDGIQFDVRCPTGLRGTPPHLDLLALRDDHAVAVTVRSIEYLTKKRSRIATAYDDLLTVTPGMQAWQAHLADWRDEKVRYKHIDLPALVKYATALGQTFPDRSSTLLYLYWEPLDHHAFRGVSGAPLGTARSYRCGTRCQGRCHRPELRSTLGGLVQAHKPWLAWRPRCPPSSTLRGDARQPGSMTRDKGASRILKSPHGPIR